MKIMLFDIGGTSIKCALSDENGNITKKDSYKTPLTSKEDFYKEICSRVDEDIEGIGISSPGIIDSKKGRIELIFAIPFLEGADVKADLEKLTGKKVTIENDGKCAALAEVWQGAGKDYEDIAFVVIGTGIGGAIVKDKQIHHGANLACGELGMMLMADENGEYSNWSRLASTVNLVQRVEDRLGMEKGTLDGHKVFEMGNEGQVEAVEELERFYRNIAHGIYNLQFSFDPQAVVIGGGISQREDLVPNIEKHLNVFNEKYGSLGKGLNIHSCRYNNDANLIGALYNYLKG